jgi:hypothetical protein
LDDAIGDVVKKGDPGAIVTGWMLSISVKHPTLDATTTEMIKKFRDQSVAANLLSEKLKEKMVMFRPVSQAGTHRHCSA